MKRYFAFFAAVLFAFCTLTACGDQPDSIQPAASGSESSQTDSSDTSSESSANAEPIMLTLHDGSSIPLCDTASKVIETENGFEWSFYDGKYSLTFPKTWESRFVIRGTTVYCLKCFEWAEVCSSLFTIETRPAETVISKPYPEMILGLSGKEYICAVFPDGGEPENAVLRNEFLELAPDRSSILKTGVCSDSVQFQPIHINDYMTADSGVKSALFGNWKTRTTKNGILDEQICFRDDGTVTFTSKDTVMEGTCLFNIYAATYDWNDQSNWGASALLFLDGGIYEATYYETNPFTLDFSPFRLPVDMSNPLNGTVFAIEP